MPKPHKPQPKGPPKSQPKPQPTHWGNVAEWYEDLVGEEGSDYHQHVIFPGLMRLLNLKHGENKRVLDLACGQGVLCRKLALAGCKVTGIDAAARLIKFAQQREKEDPLGIHYLTHDAIKLTDIIVPKPTPDPNPLVAGTFDIITIILAIQNISPLSPVWQACQQLLAPHGQLHIVMMHPCFRIMKESDWQWDQRGDSGTQYRRIKSYLTSSKSDINMAPGKAAAGKTAETTVTFHRPLQAYINTLGNAGLLIDHIDEWPSHRQPPQGIRFKELDRSRREIPMFLALRARKV